MIAQWTWPAYVAVILGGALFVILFGPLLALQSRRFGRLTLSRTIASAMIAVYGVALFAYTLLPFPDRDWCSAHASPAPQWRPFHSVDDIATAGSATSFAVLQVVFNVVLFVPWGAFARRYFGLGVALSTLSGLLGSLLVESTQGTGVWGMYGCAYRVADVDDLITNTSGALIGAVAAPLLLAWIPRADEDRARRGEPRPVRTPRRLAATLIDASAFVAVAFATTVAYRAVVLYGLGDPLPEDSDWLAQAPWQLLAFVLVLALPVLLGTPTPGQRATWLAPRYPDPRPWRRLVRLLAGVGGWALLGVVAVLPPVIAAGWDGASTTASWVWAAVSVVAIGLDRSHRGISFRLAGAEIVDSRSSAAR